MQFDKTANDKILQNSGEKNLFVGRFAQVYCYVKILN